MTRWLNRLGTARAESLLPGQRHGGEPVEQELLDCAAGPFEKSELSIGRHGTAQQFPEHTRGSYAAAARMGAGIIEYDVTFTKHRELVCRHSQCDLHTSTHLLVTPLAKQCTQNFRPAAFDPGTAQITPSDYALAARANGFKPITWIQERAELL